MNISGYISLIGCLILVSLTQAQAKDSFVWKEPAEDAFPLTHAGIAVPVRIDENDHLGVHRAYRDLVDAVRQMEAYQAQSINRTATRYKPDRPGRHTLRFRALEPGVVLQKIIIDTGGLQPSYPGAPESKIIH